MKPSRHAAGERAAAFAESEPEPAFTPVAVKPRHDGWTVHRQRTFLTVLSETGSIREACIHAGVSSRSAYRLRARADAQSFALAWDQALKLATSRLTALAFERATVGALRETWREGELVSQTRQPSDKLLMFLLQHLLPAGRPGERWTGFEQIATEARSSFPAMLDGLSDNTAAMIPIAHRDFFPESPGDPDDET